MRRTLASTVILGLTALAPVVAEEPRAEHVDFVRDVRPILERHCYECHSERRERSRLRFDLKAAAFRGGEAYGASIVPGKPDESPLIQFVADPDADLAMPPEGDRLSAEEIATLTRWVAEGADWPDGVDTAKIVDKADHWSLKPVTRPEPPDVDDGWARGAIDRFVLARLQEASLRPAPEADRRTWLRRVTFDLTGLPPMPEHVDAFLADERANAFEQVVDRLLASPAYGERWGQHWLDVVRYADTHGFEVNTPRPNAWPYRDYVIEAFNDDRPYDRFVREQIAGDALGRDAATGFLVTAAALLPGQIGQDEPSKRLARQDELDEMLTNVGEAFLGLSIGCARCHDHMFDAITHRDYYAMQAFFAGVRYGDRPLRNAVDAEMLAEVETLNRRLAEIAERLSALDPGFDPAKTQATNAKRNEHAFDPVDVRFVRFTIHDANHHPSLGLIEPCLDEFEILSAEESPRNVALATAGTKVTASGSRVSEAHRLEHVNDGEYGNARSWMSDEAGRGWVTFELPEPTRIDRVVWSRDRTEQYDDRTATVYTLEVGPTLESLQRVAGITATAAREAAALIAERSRLEQRAGELSAIPVVFGALSTNPDATRLLHRGDPEQPKDPVTPAVVAVLGEIEVAEDAGDHERRQALAEWITDPEHPLTARVMVNRIWQGHFGTGLVETSSDFGRKGGRPSHPALLDWLAREFVAGGWSVKRMHRLVVLSATYRQSSRIDPNAKLVDTDARLLWRFPSRRLEAEAVRDAMLATSGRLNPKQGGPGFDLFESRGGLTGFPPVESFSGDGLRRMVYAHKVRMERDAVFGAFDCPDGGRSAPRRRSSTTPIQALNLFNSRFTIDEATAFADRVQREVGDDPKAAVTRAYRLALGREPDDEELRDAVPVVGEHGLATLCRALFNSSEFLFLP